MNMSVLFLSTTRFTYIVYSVPIHIGIRTKIFPYNILFFTVMQPKPMYNKIILTLTKLVVQAVLPYT